MSDEEFLARWSRRKGEAKAAVDAPPPTERPDPAPSATAENPANAEVDLANLPPVESITAATDVTAFLRHGIPPELSRAALRRAWTADPAIRDFVGLAENSWDFNSPDGIAGFGPLEMTEELRRRIAEMVGRSLVTQSPKAPCAAQVEGLVLPAIETSSQSAAESSLEPTQEDHKAEIAAATAAEAQLTGATHNKGSDQ